jgi:hypothetical protein
MGFRGLIVLGQKRAKDRLKKRVRAGLVLALLGTAAVTLAACGRAGPPEPPPGPALSSYPPPAGAPAVASAPPGSNEAIREKQYEKSVQNGFDRNGNPVAPIGEKRSFPLDFLLQ